MYIFFIFLLSLCLTSTPCFGAEYTNDTDNLTLEFVGGDGDTYNLTGDNVTVIRSERGHATINITGSGSTVVDNCTDYGCPTAAFDGTFLDDFTGVNGATLAQRYPAWYGIRYPSSASNCVINAGVVACTPVLGSELVTNGDFSSATGWTVTGAEITGGRLVFDNDAASAGANRSGAGDTGKWYLGGLTISAYTSGSYDAKIGVASDNFFTGATSTGIRKKIIKVAGASTLFNTFTTVASATATLDDATSKEVIWSTFLSNLTDYKFKTELVYSIDMTVADGDIAGIAFKAADLTAGSEDFCAVYLNKGTGKVELMKVVAGVVTTPVSAAVTYSAGAPLTVSTYDGTHVTIGYNGYIVGTEQTLSESSLVSSRAGFFATSASTTFDNWTVASTVDYPYGVQWNTANSSPTLQPGVVVNSRFVPGNYDRFTIQEQMKRCVLTHTTGAVNYYLSATDSTKKADGTNAVLTGADGQVMVEIPRFYKLLFTDGNYKYFLMGESDFAVGANGAEIHEFFNEGGVSSAHKYISAFEPTLKRSGAYVDGTGNQTGTAGDLIHSVYGFIPLTYFHRTERRTYSVDGVFHQYGYYADEAMILLYLTEYKTWNSQTAIPGYTEGGTWDLAKRNKAGITASLGNASGSILWQNANSALRCTTDQTGKYAANSFRGIENFYGHVWKWVDGINVNYIGTPLTEAPVYVSNNPAQWADGTASNYTDSGIDLPLVSGYQRNLHDGHLLPNNASGGSSTTFISDYFYGSSSAGWGALLSGGGLGYSADAGVAYRNTNNTASARSAIIGGRTTR